MNDALRNVTWLVLALGVAGLVSQIPSAFHDLLGVLRSGSARLSRVGWALVGTGALVRLLAPQRLVMVHMGHEIVSSAATLGPTPKYGPAGQQWLHALFALTGPRWEAAVALDQACAAVALLFVGGLLARLRASPAAVVGALAAVGLAPVLVHDAASESLLVPATLCVFGAAHAWLEHVETRALPPLVAAFALALVAMLARPELLVLAPLSIASLTFAAPRPLALRPVPLGIALLLGAAVLTLRVAQGRASLLTEQALGNTPQIFEMASLSGIARLVGDAWWRKNGLLWPSVVPIVAWLGVGLGLATKSRDRGLVLGLGIAAWVWLVPTALDLPWVSVTRVQAPAMLLWLAAAGLGAGRWVSARARPGPWIGLGATAFALSAAFTVPALWRDDPHWTEEATLRTAIARLPSEPHVLLFRAPADPPGERVHLGLPEGSLPASGRARPLATLLDGEGELPRGGRVFVWLGTRCQMRPCDTEGEHPACAAVRQRFRLEPVLERTIEIEDIDVPAGFGRQRAQHSGQLPDLDFPWCWQRDNVTLGLYELRGEFLGRR